MDSIGTCAIQILSNFFYLKKLPSDIRKLPWSEFSRYTEYIPMEYLIRFKDYWHINILKHNKNMHWAIRHFELFGNELLNGIEYNENTRLEQYLEFYKNEKPHQEIKEILSMRKDVEVKFLYRYPHYFQMKTLQIRSFHTHMSQILSKAFLLFLDAYGPIHILTGALTLTS